MSRVRGDAADHLRAALEALEAERDHIDRQVAALRRLLTPPVPWPEVKAIVATLPGEFTASDAVEALRVAGSDTKRQSVSVLLSKMTHEGTLVRVRVGVYRALHTRNEQESAWVTCEIKKRQ